MSAPRPRSVRPLPGAPVDEREEGARAGLATRTAIVAAIVVGQLLALTVALEESLLDRDRNAWLLAGFSIVSFVVVVILARVDPPPRGRSRTGTDDRTDAVYRARPAGPERPADDRGR
jgi:hypothetical protein